MEEQKRISIAERFEGYEGETKQEEIWSDEVIGKEEIKAREFTLAYSFNIRFVLHRIPLVLVYNLHKSIDLLILVERMTICLNILLLI